MEEIKGYVEHIVYRNEDNGYTVFHLNNSDGEVTCVGSFHYIEEGELLRLKGGYTTHKNVWPSSLLWRNRRYVRPEDLVSIERYLGSGAIQRSRSFSGGKDSEKIQRRYLPGSSKRSRNRLAEIKGISERKAREIASQVEEKKDMRQADLSAEIRHFYNTGSKDLSALRT